MAFLAGLAAFHFSNWLGGLAAAAAVLAIAAAVRPWLERRLGSLWLARIISFMTYQGENRTQDMELRVDHFAKRIAETLESGKADEVLVVGHSIGSQIAVSAAARALRLIGPLPLRLSLLTLGQTIPLLSLQPQASFLRTELQELAADPRLDWIDFTAAIDSACFPLTDPIGASGLVQPDPEKPVPKLLPARFHKMFRPETYKAIRQDFKRTHFQYIMASEIEGDYDYFLITAGDKTLASRYRHMKGIANFNRFRRGAA
jgi:pimeloyl-ACP methyl ester carboxylesterase